MRVVRNAAAALVNTTVILAVIALPPWALLHYTSNPLPRAVDKLRHLDGQPLTLPDLAPFLTILLWTFWLTVTATVVIEATARAKGISAVRLPALRPVQGLAAALIAGQAATLLAPTAAALACTPSVSAPAGPFLSGTGTGETLWPPARLVDQSADTQNISADASAAGPAPIPATAPPGPDTPARVVTASSADSAPVHVVARGESLSTISSTWLHDPNRWPEICRLNWHRHFPAIGGTLRDCDIIYPGWDLRLPGDAHPPAAAPAQPPAPPPQVEDPDGVIGQPAPSPPVTGGPSGNASPQATPSPSSAAAAPASPSSFASATSSAGGSADPSAATSAADEHGVPLPDGSWVTWTLAAAISAAAALVWLQRRRRFTIETGNDDPPTQLPPPVVQLRRAVAGKPELTLHADEAEQAAAVPPLAALPPGGIGLLGGGAHAAARAALVAALASGGPHNPHQRGEVVIDAATLATLIGSDAATLGPWPRLHIADDLDNALSIIDAALLHRARILDEHTLSDLDTLRRQAPDEQTLPPILLMAVSPPPGARMRTKVSLALGSGLRISAILLGEWAHGTTVEVAADGHTTPRSGPPAQPVPPRLPVLPADAAVHLLSTLHEAHTGQPPATPSSASIPLVASRAAEPAPAAKPEQPMAAAATATATAADGRARLCVLGAPRIPDITEPGRDLRSKARELAVFLACHPDGASTRDIGEYLEPDARLSQADQRVHTNASNLRHVLSRAGSADAKNAYVIKSAGRYRLDPATVQVDIWQLRDLLRTASIATGAHRRNLLTQACDLYTAPLADGTDYEWIAAHRETVRRWGTEAHLLLAEDLLDTDPQAASHMLDKAIGLDRYNESLYRKAMHARHALHDADGIRTLMRALTKALADLDAEPEEETTALATTLRTSLQHR